MSDNNTSSLTNFLITKKYTEWFEAIIKSPYRIDVEFDIVKTCENVVTYFMTGPVAISYTKTIAAEVTTFNTVDDLFDYLRVAFEAKKNVYMYTVTKNQDSQQLTFRGLIS